MDPLEFERRVMRRALDIRDGEALSDGAHRIATEIARLRAELARERERGEELRYAASLIVNRRNSTVNGNAMVPNHLMRGLELALAAPEARTQEGGTDAG